MRWFTTSSDEFAFLSVASNAKGIIAIGGVARGVIAIGGIASIGVLSIGMNAAGSVAAIGMNAFAPISISLINGVGVFSLAGVNGWGAWSYAGVNSTGLVSRGGVNSDSSWLPLIIVVLILVGASFMVRGSRRPRRGDNTISLREFLSSPELADVRVRARLVSVRNGQVELVDGAARITVEAVPSATDAVCAVPEPKDGLGRAVVATLARATDVVASDEPSNYRDIPQSRVVEVIRCGALSPAPESETWLPENVEEVMWAISWSARLAAVTSVAGLVVSRLH
jgi:hypothetical protein